jgi:hypothetical protein
MRTYDIATVPNLFFRVGNAQGSAVTATVTIEIIALS